MENKIIYNTARNLNLEELYFDLIDWNKAQLDRPLDNFTEEWLKENGIIESDFLFALANTINKQLSDTHALIILKIIADYGVIYAKTALAAYYEDNGNIDLACKYYTECLLDYETFNLAKEKLGKLCPNGINKNEF